MPENAGQERTEKATGKKRREARQKGQVAQSKEISSAMILITVLGIFYFSGAWIFRNLAELIIGVYQNIDTFRFNRISDASTFSLEVMYQFLAVVLPFLLPIAFIGLIANVLQVGFQITTEAMTLKLDKLNPISGMKRFVSLKSLVELVKSIVKISFIGSIAYFLVKSDIKEFPLLIHQEVGQILVFIARTSLKVGFFVCLAMIVLALLDYIYQRWQYEQDLKMTKQEVKDEHKQTYGDPKVKARIRGIQMEMARRRMMEAVPEADVVITNPTRLAIALKFDAREMVAPRVLAKGSGHIAHRIREIAVEHQIPVVEEKPLAQALFKMVEIGEYIPAELYRAVAEVLAYVYRLKGMYGTA
jgi:flagellar biosynthetic protein FlhB